MLNLVLGVGVFSLLPSFCTVNSETTRLEKYSGTARYRKLQCNFCKRMWHVGRVGFRLRGLTGLVESSVSQLRKPHDSAKRALDASRRQYSIQLVSKNRWLRIPACRIAVVACPWKLTQSRRCPEFQTFRQENGHQLSDSQPWFEKAVHQGTPAVIRGPCTPESLFMCSRLQTPSQQWISIWSRSQIG